jgi:hypothetical protein
MLAVLNVSRHFYFVKYQIFIKNLFFEKRNSKSFFKIWDSDYNPICTNLTKGAKDSDSAEPKF